MSPEYDLYRHIIIYMHENFAVFEKNAFRRSVNWRSEKMKPCCYFCGVNLLCILQLLQVVNCSTLCHKLKTIIVKVKTMQAI